MIKRIYKITAIFIALATIFSVVSCKSTKQIKKCCEEKEIPDCCAETELPDCC